MNTRLPISALLFCLFSWVLNGQDLSTPFYPIQDASSEFNGMFSIPGSDSTFAAYGSIGRSDGQKSVWVIMNSKREVLLRVENDNVIKFQDHILTDSSVVLVGAYRENTSSFIVRCEYSFTGELLFEDRIEDIYSSRVWIVYLKNLNQEFILSHRSIYKTERGKLEFFQKFNKFWDVDIVVSNDDHIFYTQNNHSLYQFELGLEPKLIGEFNEIFDMEYIETQGIYLVQHDLRFNEFALIFLDELHAFEAITLLEDPNDFHGLYILFDEYKNEAYLHNYNLGDQRAYISPLVNGKIVDSILIIEEDIPIYPGGFVRVDSKFVCLDLGSHCSLSRSSFVDLGLGLITYNPAKSASIFISKNNEYYGQTVDINGLDIDSISVDYTINVINEGTDTIFKFLLLEYYGKRIDDNEELEIEVDTILPPGQKYSLPLNFTSKYDISAASWERREIISFGVIPLDGYSNYNWARCIGEIRVPRSYTTSTNNLFSKQLNLYPNPIRGTLFMDAHETYNSYTILSMEGKVLQSNKLNSQSIDLSSLSAGM